ncbi:hypothetical protein [Alicyclobacillus sp. ALC3]|nr:hypothetical protein [Alicyclobacillus sp. ALC3]
MRQKMKRSFGVGLSIVILVAVLVLLWELRVYGLLSAHGGR